MHIQLLFNCMLCHRYILCDPPIECYFRCLLSTRRGIETLQNNKILQSMPKKKYSIVNTPPSFQQGPPMLLSGLVWTKNILTCSNCKKLISHFQLSWTGFQRQLSLDFIVDYDQPYPNCSCGKCAWRSDNSVTIRQICWGFDWFPPFAILRYLQLFRIMRSTLRRIIFHVQAQELCEKSWIILTLKVRPLRKSSVEGQLLCDPAEFLTG